MSNQPENVAMRPASAQSTVPTIAIIGMEGAGKTVLAATLAKRFSTANPHDVLIVPIGVKTLTYVEHVWSILQRGEWPPSTPPGEMFELRWNYRVADIFDCEVRLVDIAGQDLRLLFGAERIHDIESLPTHLRTIAEYCNAADIVLYVVNLRDFLGESEHERRIANEAVLKSAMDCLSQGRRRRVCLVLTQSELYQHLADQRGGWKELVADNLPYAFSAHVHPSRFKIIPVAAVVDTEVVVDAEEGIPRRVPVAGFQSRGLKTLLSWLCAQAREVQNERATINFSTHATQDEPETGPTPTAPGGSQAAPAMLAESIEVDWWTKLQRNWNSLPAESRWRLLWAGAVGIVLLLWLRGCFTGNELTIDSQSKQVSALIGLCWETRGTVQNNGPAGTVIIHFTYLVNGRFTDTKSKEYYVSSGEVQPFEDYFYDYDRGDRVEVTVTAQIQ